MSTFNLLEDPWIPVRYADGRCALVAPWQLTEAGAPVSLAARRADFNGGLIQFLIGLLQTALMPEDDGDWLVLLKQPPGPDALRAAFAPYRAAFELRGDGPCFMQDYDALAGSTTVGIDALLIDSPGANTLKNNADHFIKRGTVRQVCPGCAAQALLTLQLSAPSGGAGHRTGMRGGGPLTTLVVDDPSARNEVVDQPLWRDCWLNVLPAEADGLEEAPQRAEASCFPWLAPTRTSEKKGSEVHADQAHWLQMFWSMPRRIRLDWEQTKSGRCDLCGADSDTLLTQYRTRNYGINYGAGWQHVLSPYYKDNQGEWLPLHPQPGGFSFRHWPLFFASTDGGHKLAAQVVRWREDYRLPNEHRRLWVFGYDMDNMKARCWYEAYMPLYDIPAQRDALIQDLENMIKAAEAAATMLKGRIKDALKDSKAETRGDLSVVGERYFDYLHNDFYRIAKQLYESMGEDCTAIRQQWFERLLKTAQHLFNEQVFSGLFVFADPKKAAKAALYLNNQLTGRKSPLRKVLSLPL